MQLQFDSRQNYQLDAIQAVIDVFEGQTLENGFSAASNSQFWQSAVSVTANRLDLSDEQLLINIRNVQLRNGIEPGEQLIKQHSKSDGDYDLSFINLTVEMETGTGKTYTYLRTIYELNKAYGFTKFIIVVPSVAIREGTLKNLEITHSHFQTLYDHQPINFTVYDSKKMVTIRNFATSQSIQILVMTIDSFSKDANIIHQLRESQLRPIDHLRATNPIVIVDEPQNMETEIRARAIANLNPLCTLRYSATHRNLYNLIYRLDPVNAYDLGLVKQIEVAGITEQNDFSRPFVRLNKIESGKKQLGAALTIYANKNGQYELVTVKCQVGDNLYVLSNGMECYKDGFEILSIDVVAKTIEFFNGQKLQAGYELGSAVWEIMKFQIEQTVKFHFEKESQLCNKGVKVLSLFFIDHVANYRLYDSHHKHQKGKIALWFEECFERYKPAAYPYQAHEVHDGYFSADNKGIIKDTTGDTKADDQTYHLIMKDKERLLSETEPLRFIFSHTALREGWDSPNVFQICTLNETQSTLKKRQEIGRGLRLAVDSRGERIKDKSINTLTVIANESYDDFAKQLQKEITEETGVDFTKRIKNAREKITIQLNKALTVENCPHFFELWNAVNFGSTYTVHYNSTELIAQTIVKIQALPATEKLHLKSRRAQLKITSTGITTHADAADIQKIEQQQPNIPDVYVYLQSKTGLTRKTIFEILKQSGRLQDLMRNPPLFLDQVAACINETVYQLTSENVVYSKNELAQNDYLLFNNEQKTVYSDHVYKVENPTKTIFDYLPVQNDQERKFAAYCDTSDKVAFYFLFPETYTITTPLGDYTPRWAILFSTGEPKLSNFDKVWNFVKVFDKHCFLQNPPDKTEKLKIECAGKHFELVENVGFEKTISGFL